MVLANPAVQEMGSCGMAASIIDRSVISSNLLVRKKQRQEENEIVQKHPDPDRRVGSRR
jgi:hypothetical protein